MAAVLCNKLSSLCSSSCSNPFGYLVVPTTVVTNAIPLFIGLQSLSSATKCKGSTYCAIILLFAICHISASCYIGMMISNRSSRRLAEQTSFARRLGWLLCQDKYVAAYLVILVLYAMWLWVGIGWRLDDEVHDDGSGYHNGSNGNGCPRHVGTWVDTDVLWGFVFLISLGWMLVVSLLVSCCCDAGRDYSYVEIAHDEEEQRIINGGARAGSAAAKKQVGSKTYGSVAAAALPAPTAPPYDPKIPIAEAVPIVTGKG